jgi:DNA-binding transcriptional MerR regulator
MSEPAADLPDKGSYKIGEVCRLTDTQPYVLRFWESEFPTLAPQKSRTGQRLYRREDIELVLRIKKLLYEESYTIAGARKQLEGAAAPATASASASPVRRSPPGPLPERAAPAPSADDRLAWVRDELRDILTLLGPGGPKPA